MESLNGYAILGETGKLTYLQRIGIRKDSQGIGLGDMLLKNIINFSIDKKFINIKLNTQEDNEAALSLYKKNNFDLSPRKLVIMKTS
jgi:ribosomal protein S18 acetylase RimI-like enzyme